MVIQRRPRADASQIVIRSAGEKPDKTSAIPLTTEELELEAAVQALAFIVVNNLKNCWFSETDRAQTTKEGFSVVTTVLERKSILRLTVEGDVFKVNGEEYVSKNMHVQEMARHLADVGPCHFALEKGLAEPEFEALVELISRPKHLLLQNGDFADAIAGGNFGHVSSRRIVLREVSDEETVVSKQDLEAADEKHRQKTEADVLAILEAEKKEQDGRTAEERAESLRSTVADADRMSDLIMKAAKGKQSDMPAADRQQVAKLVVECLDRAFDTLLDDPFSKTQKGKKTIAAALQRLEKELLLKMAEEGDGAAQPEEVTSAVERMTERLKMDAVVQDYTRKLKALEDSEKKILRFIRLQGLDRVENSDLAGKLNEGGVDVSDWHRLLAVSGASGTKDGTDEAAVAIAQLATMLQRLETDVSQAAKNPAEAARRVADDVKQVQAGMRQATDRTGEKISELVRSAQTDAETAEEIERAAAGSGKRLAMSRRQMVRVLAEAMQEMCQPLSVIACSTDMLMMKTLGELSEAQREMLNLVSESTARLQTLTDNLKKISELPQTLSPDANIQKALSGTP